MFFALFLNSQNNENRNYRIRCSRIKCFSSFKLKKIDVKGYDKYKLIDNFESILYTDILFLCLPTLFNDVTNEYDKDAIYETCDKLLENNYNGIVVLKSTVEPGTTDNLANKYNLKFVFNPEFLTNSTAFEDFHNQTHIIINNFLFESIICCS